MELSTETTFYSEVEFIQCLQILGVDEKMATAVLNFFQQYKVILEQIETQEKIVAAWEEKPRCYGKKSWKQEVYLHVNHTPRQLEKYGPCPCHGWGDNPDKRHYPYIGKDPVAQDKVTIAMKNWQHWQHQQKVLQELMREKYHLDLAMKRMADTGKKQLRML